MFRLPAWIWLGAWLLAFLAGMVNVLGLLGFEHHALTHMTGLTSQLAIALAGQDGPAILDIAAVMTAFVAGAALSGLLIQSEAPRWGARYGIALLLEAALLTAAAVLVQFEQPLGFYLASFACGLQNAMATTFSGSVIRTTHVSGMFTDLGISIGHRLRRLPVDVLRIRICLSTITGFCAGGVTCALLFRRLHYSAMYLPAALALGLALAHHHLRRRYAPPETAQ